ncbi:HAMP domain-containing sensor histidine kinase [Bacillus infantis]|uniref:HAMP domain-containing sensor histidine kinase n=1 Tax=Bacillus infantis TaxID=324767 RepID=UPI002155332C|nr:HAMP domain-containing sensor histidine kinase [Bacillus infantis]MCR6611328.1 HAMP domain-containing histidine kinase [Bacillus infantis]
MDTRWKGRLIIGVWALLFTITTSGIFSAFLLASNYSYKDYFHTDQFRYAVDQFNGYLGMFELYDLTLEEAKDAIAVTDADIEEHRTRYGSLPEQVGNIKSQYEGVIQGAIDTDNKEAEQAFIKERDEKIADITKNFQSDEHVRPKVVKEKEAEIKELFKLRENFRDEYNQYKKDFIYYFKNTGNGKIYTNLDLKPGETAGEFFSGKEVQFTSRSYISSESFFYSLPYQNDTLDTLLESKGSFEGTIAVASDLASSVSYYNASKVYKQKQVILAAHAAAGLAAFVLWAVISRRSAALKAEMGRWEPYYNKLPIDSRFMLLLLSVIGAVICLFGISDTVLNMLEVPYDRMELLLFIFSAALLWWLALLQWNYIMAVMKDGEQIRKAWKKSVLHEGGSLLKKVYNRSKRALEDAFLQWSTGTKMLIMFILVFGMGALSIIIFIDPKFIIVYLIILFGLGTRIAISLVKKTGYFNRIIQYTEELSSGNLGPDLEVSGRSVLSDLAANVNLLKEAVRTSQSQEAKSERLKTELITNVSHDLRTPLTSIITYTELLKQEGIEPDEREAYLEIIDRKSQRLKVLIEDLFEVSKMASGNIELAKTKADLVQLLQQSLGEYDEMIQGSSLNFRVTKPEKPLVAMVDGQKIWRVFDNLIGNILKYSLENSRVYISIRETGRNAEITFKNVSKYELNDNAEELSERFKRGDESRHTDGSGLGLAIAKSIIDLHEGELEIGTDGDLFKVILILPVEE